MCAFVLVAAFGTLGVRNLGRWLIVSDALGPAQAIVVLAGYYPFRALEAAAIYHEGWAPEIWLTRSNRASADPHRVGITLGSEHAVNLEALGRVGVPAPAIRFLAADFHNTAEEVKSIAAEVRRDGRAVILVTTKAHTRRVRATWRAVVGDHPTAIVRYTPADPFNADRWWDRTGDSHSVTHEIFGLLNVWAGLPVRPNGGK